MRTRAPLGRGRARLGVATPRRGDEDPPRGPRTRPRRVATPRRGDEDRPVSAPPWSWSSCPHRPYEGSQPAVLGAQRPPPGSSSPLRGIATCRSSRACPSAALFIAPTRGHNICQDTQPQASCGRSSRDGTGPPAVAGGLKDVTKVLIQHDRLCALPISTPRDAPRPPIYIGTAGVPATGPCGWRGVTGRSLHRSVREAGLSWIAASARQCRALGYIG
jgi:hypothetical protein